MMLEIQVYLTLVFNDAISYIYVCTTTDQEPGEEQQEDQYEEGSEEEDVFYEKESDVENI